MADTKQLKQAQAVFHSLCKFLDSDDWHYEKDEEEMMIKCRAQGEDLPIAIRLQVDADRALVSLYSELPFTIAEDRRREMAQTGRWSACIRSCLLPLPKTGGAKWQSR